MQIGDISQGPRRSLSVPIPRPPPKRQVTHPVMSLPESLRFGSTERYECDKCASLERIVLNNHAGSLSAYHFRRSCGAIPPSTHLEILGIHRKVVPVMAVREGPTVARSHSAVARRCDRVRFRTQLTDVEVLVRYLRSIQHITAPRMLRLRRQWDVGA
jgi:hypothetical protein